MRMLIAMMAALTPIVVAAAGILALGMCVASRDWTQACLVVIAVCIFVFLFERDVRR